MTSTAVSPVLLPMPQSFSIVNRHAGVVRMTLSAWQDFCAALQSMEKVSHKKEAYFFDRLFESFRRAEHRPLTDGMSRPGKITYNDMKLRLRYCLSVDGAVVRIEKISTATA